MQLSHEESVVFTSSKGLRTNSEDASSEGIATSCLFAALGYQGGDLSLCCSDRRMFRESQCEACYRAKNEDITIVGAARPSCRHGACHSPKGREKRVIVGMHMGVPWNDADP
jgi:hypothetical protein